MIITRGPMTNPVVSSDISWAFSALAEVVICMGPNPIMKPASIVFSVFIAPASNVAPQSLHPVHACVISIV